MKLIYSTGKIVPSAFLVLGCCLATFSLPAIAQTGQQNMPQLQLKVTPPRQALQNEPVKIGIEYTVPADMASGKAVVTYHNVDTGENFVKTLEIPLAKGKQKAEAVWGAEETLPYGMYVISVVLFDSTGKELARFATNPENVQSMTVHGGAFTQMLNADQVVKEVGDLVTWREELEKLEAAANAAGADTTRQKILITVLKEAKFWSDESIKSKRYDILDTNHKYLKAEVAKAKTELMALAKNPNDYSYPKTPVIPRPKERFTIRNGGFYTGDQQMFLSGPCFFNFTVKYLPVARELGFNVIGISTGPNSIFPASEEATGVPRITDYNEKTTTGVLIDILNQCAELGIKVDLGLTSHFMPNWVYEKYPDARNKFVLYNMMPYDIEHPEVLKLIERFYGVVMPIIAGHPALNSIWVANEPEYMNPNERNMEIFRPWLQKKYKTIAGLNKAWGTELKSFDDIVASGRKGNPVPDACSTDAAKYDWWKYSTERLMHHYDWQKKLIHKYDPTIPVTAKLYNGTFNPQFKPMSRADEESAADTFSSYMGISGGSYPFSKPYKDFLRSLDPTQPLANLEYKFGGIQTKVFFWQEAMQGATDINWWCWHPNPAFSSVPKVSSSVHLAALAKLDIQRLLPQISAFNKLPRADMVFLYPDPSINRYWEYFGFNDQTNEAVTKMGYNCDYASEKRIAEGRLDDYKVLVMPAANFIRNETYDKVKAFVESGKTAIVLGTLPDQDELNKSRDTSFFQPRGQVQEVISGEFKAIKFKAGKGTIYHLPVVPRSADGKGHLTPESAALIQKFLAIAFKDELPPQPVVIRDAQTGAPAIEYRTIPYTNKAGQKTYLTYIVSFNLDDTLTFEPNYNFKPTGARDLITGKKLDPKKIAIAPADVMMIEYTSSGGAGAKTTPATPRQAELQRLWLQGTQAKNRGDNAGARRAWQRMLEISPNHPGIKEAINKLPR